MTKNNFIEKFLKSNNTNIYINIKKIIYRSSIPPIQIFFQIQILFLEKFRHKVHNDLKIEYQKICFYIVKFARKVVIMMDAVSLDEMNLWI